jgi:hypothetical protein
LPFCNSGGTPVFVSSPADGTSTFTIGSSTYNITSVSCTQLTSAPIAALTAPPSAPASAAPVTYPVYACQPRPACCLAALFHRRTFGMCCR